MLFIGRKKVFKSPLAQIPNSQCVAPKVPSNCPLRMILQNQFEYSSLRHVSMPMAKLFGLTELHTFNKTFAPTITLSLSPLLAQNSIYHQHHECGRRVYLSNSGCSSSLDGKPSASSRRKTTICAGLSLRLSWGAITIPSCNSSQFGSWDPSVIDYRPPRYQSFGSVLAHSKRKNCRQSTIHNSTHNARSTRKRSTSL